MKTMSEDRRDEVHHVWIVSELYYPETTSTGHILMSIAEGLAARFSIRVICGQPTYAARGTRAPWWEERNSTIIERCWGTTWNKDSLPKRIANLVTISISIFFRLMIRLRRNDRVLVVTNPPLLPFMVSLACRLCGARCVLLIHDVYPEVTVAVGYLLNDQWFTRLLNRAVRRLYRSMKAIVVIGRDMQALVREKCGGDEPGVMYIPNPADLDAVYPQPRSENILLRKLGLSDKFVFQCVGNMGPVHDIEGLARCASALRSRSDIHFLIVGSGAKKAWLEREVRESGLANVTVLPPFPREESCKYINACDAVVSVFVPGMFGVSVPSRAYNSFAAGKPLLVVGDSDSELARTVRDENIGWTSPPGDLQSFIRVVEEAAATPPDVLSDMGRRSRALAERDYALNRIVDAYSRLFNGIETA